MFEGADVATGLMQGIASARIEPGHAPTHQLHLEQAIGQIHGVEVGDLQFTPGGGAHLAGPLHHRVVIEIKTRNGVAAAGFGRLLLQAEHPAIGGKFHHAVTLRIAHRIGEHRGTGNRTGVGARHPAVAGLQLGHQIVAMEEVVAQHQGRRRAGQELGTDQEGLGQAIGAGLHRIGNRHAPAAAIAQEPFKGCLVLGGGDNQHLPNPRQHQGGEGVINHRLIKNRQQLLTHRLGDRMQAGAAASGQDDALAAHGFRRASPPSGIPFQWPAGRSSSPGWP